MNWPVTIGVLGAFATLCSGTAVAAVITGFFRKPEDRANIAATYTDVAGRWIDRYEAANKRLEETNARYEAANRRLEESNERLQASNERLQASNKQLEESNGRLECNLRETKATQLLLITAVEQVVPFLDQLTHDDARAELHRLAQTLGKARKSANGNGNGRSA